MTIRRPNFYSHALAAIFLLAVAAPRPASAEIITGTFTDVGADVIPRFFHRAGLLPDGALVVSGGMRVQVFPPTLVSLAALSFFDPAAGAFSACFEPWDGGAAVEPVLGTARSSHTQTTLPDGRVLFTGGRTGATGTNPGAPVASVEVFDPLTGLVEAGPPMSAPRAAHTATPLPDGRVVVAGGDATGGTWQIFAPDPPGPGSWSAPLALARARTAHAAVLLPDHRGPGQPSVLLVGGSGPGSATLELLDPDGGAAALSPALLATGVDDLAAGRLDDGRVLIVGGQDVVTGDTVPDAYLYDPVSDAVESIPPPPDRALGLSDHELQVLGRFAFVFGGEQQVNGTDTELDYAAVYDRAAAAWFPLGSMNSIHDDFASVRLADDRILLVDGGVPFLGQVVATDAVEVFTPSTLRPLDVDGDGLVGFTDLLAVLALWGPCPGPADCPADFDFSGSVEFNDLLAVLSAWGPCS